MMCAIPIFNLSRATESATHPESDNLSWRRQDKAAILWRRTATKDDGRLADDGARGDVQWHGVPTHSPRSLQAPVRALNEGLPPVSSHWGLLLEGFLEPPRGFRFVHRPQEGPGLVRGPSTTNQTLGLPKAKTAISPVLSSDMSFDAGLIRPQ